MHAYREPGRRRPEPGKVSLGELLFNTELDFSPHDEARATLERRARFSARGLLWVIGIAGVGLAINAIVFTLTVALQSARPGVVVDEDKVEQIATLGGVGMTAFTAMVALVVLISTGRGMRGRLAMNRGHHHLELSGSFAERAESPELDLPKQGVLVLERYRAFDRSSPLTNSFRLLIMPSGGADGEEQRLWEALTRRKTPKGRDARRDLPAGGVPVLDAMSYDLARRSAERLADWFGWMLFDLESEPPERRPPDDHFAP